jgi:hypothetical protein
MTTVSTNPSIATRSAGRVYFWVGLVACLLGLVLAMVQFSMKFLFVPWYMPALATFGALLLVVAVVRRVSILRVTVLLLVAAFAGFQWFFLGSLMKLPAYEGPARAGRQLPAFHSTLADGRPFSEADLRDGSRRVLVFFRGRW